MKSKFWFLILSLLLVGCSLVPAEDLSNHAPQLINLGPAPELSNTTWINTDQPLRLADLRGQVVLLDMWTFG